MSKIGLIQSLFKGVSFYLPKENSNTIFKDLIIEISKKKHLVEHFFIFFDNRFECRFRIFIQSNLTSEEIEKLFSELLKPDAVKNQTFDAPKQLFKGFQPYSIIPIAFIEHSDEIYVFQKNKNSTCNFLNNLTNLIAKKTEELDFEEANQKLEFTLELLLASITVCEISSKELKKYFRNTLKNKPNYEKYLKENYGKLLEENISEIQLFRKSLLKPENAKNILNVFWRENKLNDFGLVLSLVFKVLNTPIEGQLYCLFVLKYSFDKFD